MAYTSEIEKLERRWLENPKGRNFAPLADAYRKAGELDRAVDLCKSGLERHPDYVSAHIVYGRCLIDKKDDAGAGGVFRQVLSLDPENVIALKFLAEIAERSTRFDEAVEWLTRLLAADPMNGDAAEALARAKGKAAAAKPTTPVEPVAVAQPAPRPSVAEAPTAAMGKPDFVVERPPSTTSAQPPAAPAPDLEVFDGHLDFNAAAHAAARADGLEVQEDIELSSQQVEQVEVEGLARTQYEGSGMFRLDSGAPGEAPAASSGPELVDDATPPVDLPLIMPDDMPAEPSPATAHARPGPPPIPRPPEPPPPPPPPPPAPRAAAPAPPPRVSKPAPIPAAVTLSDDDGAADAATLSQAEPVLTETMAELYLKQGHQQDALRVYQALLMQRPADGRLRRKVEQLSGGGRKASGVSAQAFLKSILAGRGAPAPNRAEPAADPDRGATTLEGAFDAATGDEAAGPPPGAPTHPANDHISLDAVFGEETGRRSMAGTDAPPSAPRAPDPSGNESAPAPAEGSGGGGGGGGGGEGGGFSFDDFFGRGATPAGNAGVTPGGGSGGGAASGPPPAGEPAAPRSAARPSGRGQRPPEDEGDLDQFQQWLKKLKS